MVIKAIVFDIGDVILREKGLGSREKLAEKFGFDGDKFSEFAKRNLTLSYTGKLSAVDFFRQLIDELKINASPEQLIEEWKSARRETTGYIDGVSELIGQLKGRYFLVSMTDTTALNDVIRREVGVYDFF